MQKRSLVLLGVLSFSTARAAETAAPLIALWPAAQLQGRDQKEETVPPDAPPGTPIDIIRNVHDPAIEVHLPPADKANGAAIIVAPGGGHRQLMWSYEGRDVAAWLNGLGIAAFVLKYRLAQTPGFKYTVEGEALRDTQRAVRLVRARAKEWRVDPARVGILGFSAGGALAALAAIRFDRGQPNARDPIDRRSCRPDFVGLVYPGWGAMDLWAPRDAAPAFLTSAGLDDRSHARATVEFYESLFRAGVPVELHIYRHGGHGGGIKDRKGIPFGTWHLRFQEWLADLGMLKLDAAGPAAARPAGP